MTTAGYFILLKKAKGGFMSLFLSRWFLQSLRLTMLLCLVCTGYAEAQSRHLVARQRLPAKAVARFKTPFEQRMLPYIQAHSAQDVAKAANTNGRLHPNNTNYATTPAFGGYQNAPYYAARISAPLASGSIFNGVAASVTADFDKDGKADLAIVQEDGTLNVLLNDGTGAFPATTSYLNPNYLTASVYIAFAADVNGDGYPDVVAYDYANNCTITWLNLGNGTFNAAVTTTLDGTYGQPNMVVVADVNGDGKADVLFANMVVNSRTSSTIYFETQLGVGDGTFGTASAAKVETFNIPAEGILPADYGITLGDINGDGKVDVAVSIDEISSQQSGTYAVAVGLGNGDGSFSGLGATFPISAPLTFQNAAGYDTTILAFSDVNGDVNLDLVADINNIVETTLGKGDGTFGAPATTDISAVTYPSQSVLVDVNGDGKPDLVVGGGSMAVYIAKGDGSFAAPVSGSQYIIDGTGFYGLSVADFNGDGKLDVAELGEDYKQISLFFNTGTGGFRGAPMVTANGYPDGLNSELLTSGKYTAGGYSSPLLAYFPPDGSGTQLVTNVNDGKGSFTSTQAIPFPSDIAFIEPVHGDFNGDGLEDLVYANQTGDVLVALSKGDGTFTTPVSVGLPAAACSVSYAAAGDLNSDGKTDLVIAYGGDASCGSSGGGSSGYYVALGNGDGTFSTPDFTQYGTELYSVTLADLNSDGALDLVTDDTPFAYGSGFNVSAAIGQGDGTFGTSSLVVANYLVSDVAAGDINNDGKPDLVLNSEEVQGNTIATGGILLVTGNGDFTFGTPTQIATGNFFLGLQLADMNNDGNLDIVATHNTTLGQPNTYFGMVTLLGYGNGQFAEPVNELETMLSTTPQVGNFVSDNAPDVMTSTPYGPALFIGQGGSSMSLSTSASYIPFGQAETLTATIAASMSGRPSAGGTVSFYDGAALVGTAKVSSGTAKFTPISLVVGIHTFKAVYSGDASYNPNTSSTASVTVSSLAAAFTLAATPATLTVTGGSQGLVTLNLTANASFSGAVTLQCSGMPANGTCSINPNSVTLAASGTSTATLVVGTTGTHAELRRTANPWGAPTAAFSLAALLGIFFGRRKRLSILAMFLLGGVLSMGGILTGCSGNGSSTVTPSSPVAAPGNYTITVSATPASGSAASSQTIQISLAVN